ncbi:MAG: RNA polymerase sigma factor [Lentisphaeria bacterium]|nr:RNA polymerase sigma factor [Lentisphaeria bacterium]
MALNEQSFLELLERYKDEFYRYVYRVVWNVSAAEDVFASAVQVAWTKKDSFIEGTNFRAWMYRILTNKCYVANRETKRSSIDIDSIDERHFIVEQDLNKRAYEDPNWFFEECGDELYQALKKLSTAEKSCLLLLSVEKQSYKEIASILEMPVGTVMTHLSRGRTKLRRLLSVYAENSGILSKDNKHFKKESNKEGESA